MATSALKSTTKRTPIGESSSRSSAHRRSRSLSVFSRSLTAAEEDSSTATAPPSRGKFVKAGRGSGFPEISLDDLAADFSDSGGAPRGRSTGRRYDAAPESERRGRSVSRHGNGNCLDPGRVVPGSDSRRRRSMSVARYRISASESNLDVSQKHVGQADPKSREITNKKILSSDKLAASNDRQGLRRSLSQRDLRSRDDYSSQSSTLTDDEGRDACYSKNGIERTIRAVYSQNKSEHPNGDSVNGELYEAMRKELRYAVEEIRMELEQAVIKTKMSESDSVRSNRPDSHQAVSTFTRNHAIKPQKSEKRTQDLSAELLLENQHGRELSKPVKELLPNPRNNVAVEKPSRSRRRSNDRNRMSKRLTEEAERYFEDFISNVEDTDISSLDGERSDASSVIRGISKPETFHNPQIHKAPHNGTDGVTLPWLQWESNQLISREATQDHIIVDSPLQIRDYMNKKPVKPASYVNQAVSGGFGLRIDMDDYLKPTSNEELLSERWSHRERLNSGSLMVCDHLFF